jgi:hypothetical protein
MSKSLKTNNLKNTIMSIMLNVCGEIKGLRGVASPYPRPTPTPFIYLGSATPAPKNAARTCPSMPPPSLDSAFCFALFLWFFLLSGFNRTSVSFQSNIVLPQTYI